MVVTGQATTWKRPAVSATPYCAPGGPWGPRPWNVGSSERPLPNANATTSAMRRRTCLFVLFFLPGCWTGGLVKESDIAYQHESVRWVYKAGGQFAVLWGVILVPESNRILEVQPGDQCVLVTEGQAGGQCSAAPQAALRGTHALDLRTGRPTLARALPSRIEKIGPVWQDDRKSWETRLDQGLLAHGSLDSDRVFLRLPADTLILDVKDGSLGWVISGFRMPDNSLVLGFSYGYVVCIDTAKLPMGQQVSPRQ